MVIYNTFPKIILQHHDMNTIIYSIQSVITAETCLAFLYYGSTNPTSYIGSDLVFDLKNRVKQGTGFIRFFPYENANKFFLRLMAVVLSSD